MTWRLMSLASSHRRKCPYQQWEFGSNKCWCETKFVLYLCLNILKYIAQELLGCGQSLWKLWWSCESAATLLCPQAGKRVWSGQGCSSCSQFPITRLELAAPVGPEGLKGRGCAGTCSGETASDFRVAVLCPAEVEYFSEMSEVFRVGVVLLCPEEELRLSLLGHWCACSWQGTLGSF